MLDGEPIDGIESPPARMGLVPAGVFRHVSRDLRLREIA